MNKRLTRSDYLFALLFIFMLFCTLGAFFYGLKLGAERTEARYEQQRKAEETASKGLTAYHQSYLVSFYHTIYLPYKDFQNKWFQDLASIESDGSSVDPSSLLKELAKLAEEKAKSVEAGSAPETSPSCSPPIRNTSRA
ncbi:hypothetical protein N6H14_30735 [Paenibacillus sp. CC-CFT747]|nr:hypothetical protein N6H14_30735 [Paenibacillus sp. CC-CFT747]